MSEKQLLLLAAFGFIASCERAGVAVQNTTGHPIWVTIKWPHGSPATSTAQLEDGQYQDSVWRLNEYQELSIRDNDRTMTYAGPTLARLAMACPKQCVLRVGLQGVTVVKTESSGKPAS